MSKIIKLKGNDKMRNFIRNISRYKVAILGILAASCIVAYVIWKIDIDIAMTIVLAFLVGILVFLLAKYVKLIKNGIVNDAKNEEKNKVLVGIVIVIAIIGLFPLSNMVKSIFGMVIDNEERAYSLTASQMSKQDKEIYNSMIKNYIGDRRDGSEVKTMIDNIIVQNDDHAGERGKFISIKVKGNIPNYYRPEVLEIICDAANTYNGGINTQENVDKAKEEMRRVSKVISAGRIYSVEPEEKDGIIHTVYIKLIR